MLDFLKTRIVEPRTDRIPPQVLLASALKRRPTSVVGQEQPPKRGMWVVYQGRVGILTNLEPGDVATVALVDVHGLTFATIHVPAAELHQATYAAIPASRRPTRNVAAELGYV